MKKRSIWTNIHSGMALIVIPLAILTAWGIFAYILGNPQNFEGANPDNQPLTGNYLGIIYKGGPIVILLISFQLILITYAIERFLSIQLAMGGKHFHQFLQKVKESMIMDKYADVFEACQEQKGSVANVINNGVEAYERIKAHTDPNQRIKLIQNELENAAQLEVPLLQRNMSIISTIAQIATLIGLLGTVTGMIIAFSALARVGAPDAVGLASGISQALITTALGISTSAVAIVVFNYFNGRIEKITYGVDEAIFIIVQSLQAKK